MLCRVNPDKAINEICRVAKEEAALMVFAGNILVGTMGLIKADLWYGDGGMLVNRWFFVLPGVKHMGVGALLQIEAQALAAVADLPLVIYREPRRRGNGVLYATPRPPVEGA